MAAEDAGRAAAAADVVSAAHLFAEDAGRAAAVADQAG